MRTLNLAHSSYSVILILCLILVCSLAIMFPLQIGEQPSLQAIRLSAGIILIFFLTGFFKGDFGQYFTPREIITFAVEMMEPNREELVLDPACGSGGFLLYTLDKIRRKANEFAEEGTSDHKGYWHEFAETTHVSHVFTVYCMEDSSCGKEE